MKTPVAGLIIGAFVGGLAAVPLSAPSLLSESLGQMMLLIVGFLMVPISSLVAIFTISGFRLGRVAAEGRPRGNRITIAAGLATALVFGGLMFGACTVTFDDFLTTFFAAPIALAVVGSVVGGLVAKFIRAKTVDPVLPLEGG